MLQYGFQGLNLLLPNSSGSMGRYKFETVFSLGLADDRNNLRQYPQRKLLVWLFLALLTSSAGLRAQSGNGITSQQQIETNPFSIASLPVLQEGVQTHQFCSYDRAGDNNDAEYFPLYTDARGECVIFDAMGPGCLYRQHMNIWYGKPVYQGIRIRYYFDDESTPRVDMDVSKFFSSSNPIFQAPLAFDGKDPKTGRDRFRILYHPIFFKKRLKIALTALPGGPPTIQMPWIGKAKDDPDNSQQHWHWYQYTYQLFTDDPGMESWTPEAGRAMMPALVKAWTIPHPDKKPVQDQITSDIPPGKTATLWQTQQPGAITALRFSLSPWNNLDAMANTWLKITFDGASHPQIEAPLCCFFGANRTKLTTSYSSLLLGWSNGEAYSYFPMPFWKSALIQIENRSRKNVSVNADIDCKTGSDISYPEQTCGSLFAQYHREDPRTEGKDYTYLALNNASGQVVGHAVSRWNTCCEEDERTYFDGSKSPWINGDGYEDDQGMGWGLTWGPPPLTLAVFGAPSGKVGSGGLYRFFLSDKYYFSSGIQNGHQTYGPHSPSGDEGHYRVGTEESVTFWYGHLKPRLVQSDEFDVGQSSSEAAHAYHAQGNVQRVSGNWWYDGEYNNVLFKTPAITDDGVSFTKSSTFTVAISPDNQGVRLRRRCDKENNRQEARVFIDDQLVTERPWYSVDFDSTYRNIRWMDTDFEIPSRYTKGKNKIAVKIEFLSSKTGRWDEYHYWVYSYLSGH
jgi:hypothetical protein